MSKFYVSQKPIDKKEVQPAIDELQKVDLELREVSALLADNGYFSSDNCTIIERAGITPYIAVGREKHNTKLEDRFCESVPLAEDADYKTTMQHRLKTKVGKALYAARKSTVEPVFGIIKHVLGFRQFSVRGFESVQGEWDLVSIAWNLKRMHVLA